MRGSSYKAGNFLLWCMRHSYAHAQCKCIYMSVYVSSICVCGIFRVFGKTIDATCHFFNACVIKGLYPQPASKNSPFARKAQGISSFLFTRDGCSWWPGKMYCSEGRIATARFQSLARRTQYLPYFLIKKMVCQECFEGE